MKLLPTTLALAISITTTAVAETWVTEETVQIDRCASAWFVTRFIDPEPRFLFFTHGEKPPAGTSYDFYGAKYFHRGPDCTFISLIKANGKSKDRALIAMNPVVNDVFAWRTGPGSLGAAFRTYIDSLRGSSTKDEDIYAKMLPLFDILYLRLGGTSKAMLEGSQTAVAQSEIASLLSSSASLDRLEPHFTQEEIVSANLPSLDAKFLASAIQKLGASSAYHKTSELVSAILEAHPSVSSPTISE